MFENYSSSVQVGHNCECHAPSHKVPEQYTPAKITRDDLGNITKLQWAPDARFTINITSDTNISIIEGSQVLNKSGMTPDSVPGWEGLYTYNIVDSICWQYTNGSWTRLPNIVTSNRGSVVVTFGNDSAKTKISIKNFRGETIFTDTEDGNFVPLTIDDQLAEILLQGFYNIDVYQISATSTKLVRRITVSVTPSQTQQSPTISTGGSCHSNKGFVTDGSLNYKDGILSVNIADNCQYGSILPVSGNAVVEYAQPKNLVVEADLNMNVATIGAMDIFNYHVFGGEVSCLVNGLRLSLYSCTKDEAVFKESIVQNDTLISHLLTIDSTGTIISYKCTESPLTSVTSLNNIQQAILQQMSALNDQHQADIQRMDSALDSMESTVTNMQSQIGDLRVTEKIVELYNYCNELNTSIREVSDELDNKLEQEDVKDIVDESVAEGLSDEKMIDLIQDVVANNIRLDGGVVE